MGPVVGVMGVLQAVETVKLLVGGEAKETGETSMLLFSSNGTPPFRSVRLRSRRKGCFACSAESQLSLNSLKSGSLDYALFCGIGVPSNILEPEERISAVEYEKLRKGSEKHVLLDVREKVQFDICHLEGSINVPFSSFQGGKEVLMPEEFGGDVPVYVVCRLGNDSQVVARKLKDKDGDGKRFIGDIKGGLKDWREQVDTSWPEY